MCSKALLALPYKEKCVVVHLLVEGIFSGLHVDLLYHIFIFGICRKRTDADYLKIQPRHDSQPACTHIKAQTLHYF